MIGRGGYQGYQRIMCMRENEPADSVGVALYVVSQYCAIALIRAGSCEGSLEVVRALLAAGADKDAQDVVGG